MQPIGIFMDVLSFLYMHSNYQHDDACDVDVRSYQELVGTASLCKEPEVPTSIGNSDMYLDSE